MRKQKRQCHEKRFSIRQSSISSETAKLCRAITWEGARPAEGRLAGSRENVSAVSISFVVLANFPYVSLALAKRFQSLDWKIVRRH